MNAMAILVTGGAGYIGSHMVHELVDAGDRVAVLDNLSAGFDWAVAKGVPLVIGDTGRLLLNTRMFLLGAAFTLLETKAVVQMALLFGSTWLVNSAVFFPVLVLNSPRQLLCPESITRPIECALRNTVQFLGCNSAGSL
jgi:nucleoside-diphosphate-sugar epimerase